MKLLGKVALVTGGASGLGRATASRLVKNGCCVALFDLPSSQGQEVASQISEDRCMFLSGDVTSHDDVKRAIGNVVLKWNKINIAVNCAGIMFGKKTYNPRTKAVHELEQFSRVTDIHINGTFNINSKCAKEMAKNEPEPTGECGVIVNTASVAAYDGPIGTTAYSAAKGGIVSMTLPMARDLAPCRIRVVTIAPGIFDTPIIRQVSKQGLDNSLVDVLFPRRPGDPDEFAHAVQMIVENPMLNGEVVRLDAGTRLQPGDKKMTLGTPKL